MTVGEMMCLRSSIRQMIKNLNDPSVNTPQKIEFIEKELKAMERLIDSNIKQ